MLIVDLSETHEFAFANLIAIYKQRLSDDGISEKEKFESIRVSILSSIFNIDENIHLVETALAKWN